MRLLGLRLVLKADDGGVAALGLGIGKGGSVLEACRRCRSRLLRAAVVSICDLNVWL